MARCPMVRPDVTRVPLSEGDWIDVKRRLTVGEYREMVERNYTQAGGDKLALNLKQVGVSKVLAYVVGWSFVNFDGSPLAFNEHSVRGMDPDVFREVLDAVERHEDAEDAARSAAKNETAGSSTSAAI